MLLLVSKFDIAFMIFPLPNIFAFGMEGIWIIWDTTEHQLVQRWEPPLLSPQLMGRPGRLVIDIKVVVGRVMQWRMDLVPSSLGDSESALNLTVTDVINVRYPWVG